MIDSGYFPKTYCESERGTRRTWCQRSRQRQQLHFVRAREQD